jgi:hypothetical protein
MDIIAMHNYDMLFIRTLLNLYDAKIKDHHKCTQLHNAAQLGYQIGFDCELLLIEVI